jgi:hypothetical protein
VRVISEAHRALDAHLPILRFCPMRGVAYPLVNSVRELVVERRRRGRRTIALTYHTSLILSSSHPLILSSSHPLILSPLLPLSPPITVCTPQNNISNSHVKRQTGCNRKQRNLRNRYVYVEFDSLKDMCIDTFPTLRYRYSSSYFVYKAKQKI